MTQSTSDQTTALPRTRPIKRGKFRTFYVKALLFCLPLAVAFFTLISKKARQEHAYLPAGFAFALDVRGFGRGVVLQRTKRNWRSLKKTTPASHIDYIIEFRDLDFAFEVFSGSITLKKALAGRLFATYGPNDKGVAITYLFHAILNTLFGWRKAYRR
ncbi:MAG: D-alanyl-D-alanine carboxypeptidase [Coriobacteriia bacterium]|nr:D-alanyl-D-alanine carboxypeptidase [Coriobacteriia bacterium]